MAFQLFISVLFTTFITFTFAQRSGDPLFVVCDRNITGCFSEFRDPMTCSGINDSVTTFISAAPTNRFNYELKIRGLLGKVVMFDIENQFEMPPEVLSIDNIGEIPPPMMMNSTDRLQTIENTILNEDIRTWKGWNPWRGQCFVRVKEARARVINITSRTGEMVKTLRTVPFGISCGG